MRREKKRWRKRGRTLLSILLAVIMAIELPAGSLTVYASEQKDFIEEGTEDLGHDSSREANDDGTETDNSDIENGTGSGANELEEADGEKKSEENNPVNGDLDESVDEDMADGDTTGEDIPDEGEGDQNPDDKNTAEEGAEEDSMEEGTSEEDVTEENTAEDIEGEEDEAEDENGKEIIDPDDLDVSLSEKKNKSFSETQLQAIRKEMDDWAERTGRVPNGYISADFEAERLSEPVEASDDSFPAARADAFIPIKYDARSTGMVSRVKNQGAWGTCWAFSALASAESSYKKIFGVESEPDLSETHLVNFFYNGNAVLIWKGRMEDCRVTGLRHWMYLR